MMEVKDTQVRKRNLSFKPITDIVSVADSIDAATDIVGKELC